MLREIDFITSSFQHHDMLMMLTNELMYVSRRGGACYLVDRTRMCLLLFSDKNKPCIR